MNLAEIEGLSEALNTESGWRAWCRRVNDPGMSDEECDKAYARLRALLLPDGPFKEEEGST
jgi:hypothetical protein